MKCPVCKTECAGYEKCPHCNFGELNPLLGGRTFSWTKIPELMFFY